MLLLISAMKRMSFKENELVLAEEGEDEFFDFLGVVAWRRAGRLGFSFLCWGEMECTELDRRCPRRWFERRRRPIGSAGKACGSDDSSDVALGNGMILTSTASKGVVRGVAFDKFLSSSQILTVTFSSDIVQVGGDFRELGEFKRFECFWDEKGESFVVNDEADKRDKEEPREWVRSTRFSFVGEDGKNDRDFLLFPVFSTSSRLSSTEDRMLDNIKVMERVR
jgi:hypothetical protein